MPTFVPPHPLPLLATFASIFPPARPQALFRQGHLCLPARGRSLMLGGVEKKLRDLSLRSEPQHASGDIRSGER